MKVEFRATENFLGNVRTDLERPHAFADERVGFISVRAAQGADHLVLLAEGYHPVADRDYVQDQTVGAMMGPEAIRKALEVALLKQVGMFHVHMHFHPGRLWFSRIDLREQPKFVPDFFKVCPKMPHGALVLSRQSAAGRVWLGRDNVTAISEFTSVGAPTKVIRPARDGSTDFYV